MRIPKGILKIGKMATDDGALSGVLIVRTGGESGTATATDGRAAIRVTFTEPPSDRLPGFGEAEQAIAGFTQIIPADVGIDADSIAEKQPGFVVLDETAPDGRVMLICPMPSGSAKVDAAPVDGQFPCIDDVLPAYQIQSERGSRAAVRVMFSADQLIATVKAMADAVKCATGLITLDVPLDPTRPVRMYRADDGIEADGLIMPYRGGEDEGDAAAAEAAPKPGRKLSKAEARDMVNDRHGIALSRLASDDVSPETKKDG